MTSNPWDAVLEHLHSSVGEEDFRRWFGPTAYASDSGDQLTIWVPTEAILRHLSSNYQDRIDTALATIGRRGTHIRFVVTGVDEDEESDF